MRRRVQLVVEADDVDLLVTAMAQAMTRAIFMARQGIESSTEGPQWEYRLRSVRRKETP